MNTANALTFFRFVLSAAFIAVYYLDIPYSSMTMLVIFVVASFTDFLDGYIARKYNQITVLGKLIDPLADKVLVFSALLIFVESNIVAALPVIIILSRDLMVGIFRAIAAQKDVVISANIYGKFKTVVQMISVITILFALSMASTLLQSIGVYLLYFATVLTILSGYIYVRDNLEVLK